MTIERGQRWRWKRPNVVLTVCELRYESGRVTVVLDGADGLVHWNSPDWMEVHCELLPNEESDHE
jgi:hypothetical protein